MTKHHKLNYIEIPSQDLAATRQFFTDVFGWEFVDYGPDYIAASNAVVDCGFYTADVRMKPAAGSALVVLYSDDLSRSLTAVEGAGGCIVKPIFEFPGGRRFHFTDPGGSEFAVWGEAVS